MWCVFHDIYKTQEKHFRHRKAGNHAVITTSVGSPERVFDVYRVGLPALPESHINHMLIAKVSWDGRRL